MIFNILYILFLGFILFLFVRLINAIINWLNRH